MNNQIIFTPNDMIEIFKSVCYLITLVSTVVGIIVAAISKAKAPGRAQDKAIKSHEKRLNKIEHELNEQVERSKEIQKDTRVYQRGILALINHSIDGNNIEELEKCRDELTEIIYHSD